MENAADALQMAAAVLIFVLALSISINAFGEARQTSQVLLEYNDREYDTTYVEQNGSTQRTVSIESIIPTIYKAAKENNKIVFENCESLFSNNGVYKQREGQTQNFEPVYELDFENMSLAGDTQKEQFLMGIFYGNDLSNFNDLSTTFSRLGYGLNNDGLYDIIKGVKLTESIGVYYQEEARSEGGDTSVGGSYSESNVPEANLTEKRVITYSRN